MFNLLLIALELYLAILATRLPDGSTDFLHDSPASTTQSH